MPRRRPFSLSHGRPTSSIRQSSTSTTSTLASRHTRHLIREHHTLQKQHAAALAASNTMLAASLVQKIEDAGGLKTYQQASRTGQSRERGGDAGAVLVGWLRARGGGSVSEGGTRAKKLKMLDVGALTCDTAASRSAIFEHIARIDLESQEQGILKQDFMERPLPQHDTDKFDVVSLSLVLNYVPSAAGRGMMLKRVESFLRQPSTTDGKHQSQHTVPLLFIVLPAPCVLNSRYMDHSRLEAIVTSLGYAIVEFKTSAKLAYYLCALEHSAFTKTVRFKKVELRTGKQRNNFAITME